MKTRSVICKYLLGFLLLAWFGASAHAFYDPSVGRWVNRDPIAEDGGVNLHSFVFNDPINWFDPDGQNPKRRWIDPVILWLNNTRASQWAGSQMDKGLQCCVNALKSSKPDKNVQRVLDLLNRLSAGQGNQVVKELEALSKTEAGRRELLKIHQTVSTMIPCAKGGAPASTMIGLQQSTGVLARGGK